jgi:hypothetical protein
MRVNQMYRAGSSLFLVMVTILLSSPTAYAAVGDDEGQLPSKVTSLSASTNQDETSPDQERKQYWRRTFDEIRNLRTNYTYSQGRSTLSSQWKSFMDRGISTERFEGFVSWERLLQDWADEIQEYMEQENEEDYPLSTFGRPSVSVDRAVDNDIETGSPVTATSNQRNESLQHQRQSFTWPNSGIVLPGPRPAKKGEAVLPHTDISDKSKRIWIVTTASLPWKTGTAVNPLLRAAYLSEGRRQAGGSVTLHLPWLEREADQVLVYGAGNTFSSQEEQEVYVRRWLRESAGMPVAAGELSIEWYTAWHSKAENSIYSMGDITALIPEDEVDICILEEPEHLNWYV